MTTVHVRGRADALAAAIDLFERGYDNITIEPAGSGGYDVFNGGDMFPDGAGIDRDGLELPGLDDHTRLLELYESLILPEHFMYNLPYLAGWVNGEHDPAAIEIGWTPVYDSSLTFDEDTQEWLNDDGKPFDQCAGHVYGLIVYN